VSFVGGPNKPQTNPRWRTAAILKNVYLCKWWMDFDETWHSYTSRASKPPQLTKIQNFWNPRWRRLPSWKIKNCVISKPRLINFDIGICTCIFFSKVAVITCRMTKYVYSKLVIKQQILIHTVNGDRKQQKSLKSNINHNNIDIQAMLLLLILPFMIFAVFALLSVDFLENWLEIKFLMLICFSSGFPVKCANSLTF